MLGQILAGTPPWVFVLFFVLLGFGLMQARPRAAAKARVIVLPVLMVLLSIGGVLSSFGPRLEAVAGWALGMAAALGLNQVLRQPRGVRYDPVAGRFLLPGSWVPLALMMAIYFAKYTVGATLVLAPAVAGQAWFVLLLSLAFGALSGTFLARFLQIWAAQRAAPAAVAGLETLA